MGKTVFDILAERNYFKETTLLKARYEEHLKSFDKFNSQVGKQFRSKSIENRGHRLINDQDNSNMQNVIRQKTNVKFFNVGSISLINSQIEDDDIYDNFNYRRIEMELPFHPYIKMFDLESDSNVYLLADDLELYEYDSTVSEKLVLPQNHRDLIDVLVNDADIFMEDIVSNKSGGTAILCKGESGLGKTLTAEVYSETIQKPLYSVHSGQLGTNPDTIDKNLDRILRRAEKWNAILLLDEADVYIRKRDNSMEHNSIVAAFLRKLERFDGIVFLTTNRANDVDDAISSRCIAIITYEYPEGDELFKIWKVLSENYKIELSDELYNPNKITDVSTYPFFNEEADFKYVSHFSNPLMLKYKENISDEWMVKIKDAINYFETLIEKSYSKDSRLKKDSIEILDNMTKHHNKIINKKLKLVKDNKD